MFFPEFLYKLSQRDEQVTWLDPSYGNGDNSAANVSVAQDLIVVPVDRALVLQSVSVFADPGAGQNVVSMFVRVQAPGTAAEFRLAQELTNTVADEEAFINWSGSIIVQLFLWVAAIGLL